MAVLEKGHWAIESFTQRMTSKQWRGVLLLGDDRIVFKGKVRALVGKNLGSGVVEVSKEPLSQKELLNESMRTQLNESPSCKAILQRICGALDIDADEDSDEQTLHRIYRHLLEVRAAVRQLDKQFTRL